MLKSQALKNVLPILIVVVGLGFLIQRVYVYAPDQGQISGPISGLNPQQLRKFYDTRTIFQKEFTPEEGLGPVFNGRSCFECHGDPVKSQSGGEGRDIVSTGILRIGKRFPGSPKAKIPLNEVITNLGQDDVDILLMEGGPVLQKKSITSEFKAKYPPECQIEISRVPTSAELISLRHSPPLFGMGLIDAIPDRDIVANAFQQLKEHPTMAGRPLSHIDPLTYRSRIGRFGWKAQGPNMLIFAMEAMSGELGLTTFFQENERSATGISQFPPSIYKFLPGEPNDTGKVLTALTYHISLLAPPPRGPITAQVQRGEKVFDKANCSVCHIPQMHTAEQVYVVDPESPVPKLNYIEVQALERRAVPAYSDFLLHNMGVNLADGIPQAGSLGGEWRTTPLWGLRNKKFLLHDGRTTDLQQAILAHGGQAQLSVDAYQKLSPQDKEDLLSFLKSL